MRRFLAIGIAALALYTVALGARDLWNPNEPIYGQAVTEMVERDDWARPSVDGRFFDEKPILYFWLSRAVAELRGSVDETAVRLPSALSAVALILIVGLWVRRHAGERRGLWAAALLGTTYIVFWIGRAAQVDLLLTFCVAAAHVALYGEGRLPTWRWAFAGLCIGLGLLTKGPVALILIAMPHALMALIDRDARLLRGIGPWVAVGVAIVAAAPWYAYIAATSPDGGSLSELLFRQNVTRFLTPWDHIRPWWYYGMHLWMDMAPWAFFLVAARRPLSKLDRFGWLWLGTTVLFFSLSGSKRSVYLLPCAPAVALLAAPLVAEPKRIARILMAAIGAVLLAGAIYGLTRGDLVGLQPTLIVLLVVALAWFASAWRWPALAPASLAVLYLTASLSALPAFDARKSARPFGEDLAATVAAEEPIVAYGLWPWRAAYNYYSGRRFVRVDAIEPLRFARERREFWLVVERGKLEELAEFLDGLEPTLDAEIGSNRVLLFRIPRATAAARPVG